MLLLRRASARGDEPDFRTVAREKFAEGRREFDQHNYPRALALLKESYALAPYPDLLFNIGRCQEELGHYHEALAAYERYLAVNPGDLDVRQRAENMRERSLSEPEPSPEPSPSSLFEPLPSVAPQPLSVASAPPRRTPLYRKWWLWTAVVGVAAVAVGVGLGVGLSGAAPARTFPPLGGP